METTKQRETWLDYLKFFAMLLVVVYHTPPRYDTAHEVALFNMGAPVFFFAAGYLFHIKKFQSFWMFLRHRSRQILVPYITFFALFYALWLLFGRAMAGPEEQSINVYVPLQELVEGTPHVVLGPFWFLTCLLSIQILYWPLRRLLSGWLLLAVTMILSMSLLIMPNIPWLHYWNLHQALLYMPLYATGECLRQEFRQIEFDTASHTLLWLTLAIIGLLFLIFAPLHINRDVAYVLAPEAVMLTLPAWKASCSSLAHHWGNRQVVYHVAVTSITYLALQNYVIGFIKILDTRLLNSMLVTNGSIWSKVIIAIAVMAILYPLALLIERYAPWMLGKGKLFAKW